MVMRSLVLLLIPLFSSLSYAEELELGAVDCPTDLDGKTQIIKPEEVRRPLPTLEEAEQQINQFIEEFQRGGNDGLQLAQKMIVDLNAVKADMSANPMINAPLKGPGVIKEISDIDKDMTSLARMMDDFDPNKYDPNKQSRWQKVVRVSSKLTGSKAMDVVATFRSHEGTIMHILEGLENNRVALEVQNGMIDREIDRLRGKMDTIMAQQDVWQITADKLDEFCAKLEKSIAAAPANSSEQRRLKSKLDVARNELVLPIKQTVMMLDLQYTTFEALVVAHRSQQDQNREGIRQVRMVSSTASEVLPAIVYTAANTAQSARVQASAQKATDMMNSGLQAVAKQSKANALRLVESMKAGVLDQDIIFNFRSDMVANLMLVDKGKAETLKVLEAKKATFDKKRQEFAELINAAVNGDSAKLLGFDGKEADQAKH